MKIHIKPKEYNKVSYIFFIKQYVILVPLRTKVVMKFVVRPILQNIKYHWLKNDQYRILSVLKISNIVHFFPPKYWISLKKKLASIEYCKLSSGGPISIVQLLWNTLCVLYPETLIMLLNFTFADKIEVFPIFILF